MQINKLHEALSQMTASIRVRELNGGAHAFINWLGDEVRIKVEAAEDYDANGHWEASKSFRGSPADCAQLVADAEAWVNQLPCQEDRAIELIVRKLNEIADKLPRGSTDVSVKAWEEIHKMLMAKADRIASSGLPSPNRIADLKKPEAVG